MAAGILAIGDPEARADDDDLEALSYAAAFVIIDEMRMIRKLLTPASK